MQNTRARMLHCIPRHWACGGCGLQSSLMVHLPQRSVSAKSSGWRVVEFARIPCLFLSAQDFWRNPLRLVRIYLPFALQNPGTQNRWGFGPHELLKSRQIDYLCIESRIGRGKCCTTLRTMLNQKRLSNNVDDSKGKAAEITEVVI